MTSSSSWPAGVVGWLRKNAWAGALAVLSVLAVIGLITLLALSHWWRDPAHRGPQTVVLAAIAAALLVLTTAVLARVRPSWRRAVGAVSPPGSRSCG